MRKISTYGEDFDFLAKFWFLKKISIFENNFDLWISGSPGKFSILARILIFHQNFNFWAKLFETLAIIITDANWISFRIAHGGARVALFRFLNFGNITIICFTSFATVKMVKSIYRCQFAIFFSLFLKWRTSPEIVCEFAILDVIFDVVF